MSTPVLHRETFARSRAVEFFTEEELVRHIGVDREQWPLALDKELIDNALDATEAAGKSPVITVTMTDDAVTVHDNGPGMPTSTITRLLDARVRVSSNIGYVSPTRGQLGNASKCLLGATCIEQGSIEITTGGERHTITLTLNEITESPDITHTRTSARGVGSSITRRFPQSTIREKSTASQPRSLARSERVETYHRLLQHYASLNPHATFILQGKGFRPVTFPASNPAFPKWLPSTPTSPHWYTVDTFTALLMAFVHADRQRSGRGRTVREILQGFDGLARSESIKRVTDAAGLTGAALTNLVVDKKRLDPKRVARLLKAMQAEVRHIPPKALGVFGKAYCKAQVHGWGATKVRYRLISDTFNGIPYVIEVACGERQSGKPRAVEVGCNFSPLVEAEYNVYEIYHPLSEAGVDEDDPIALFVHVTTPHPPFSGHAKRDFAFGDEDPRSLTLQGVIADVLPLKWKERKARALRGGSTGTLPRGEITRRAFAVTEAAYLKMSANGKYNADRRQVFYAVRDLSGLGNALKDHFYTQTLLPKFLRLHPELTAEWDITADGRGHITEPHTAHRVDLSTTGGRHYIAEWDTPPADSVVIPRTRPTIGPRLRFRSVLFIEKEGFAPLFTTAKLAERFDLAIMSTKGMSNVAARNLVEQLSNEGVTIFVLHDFDRSGFSILHTLGADSDRHMFTTKPTIVDLGLRLADIEAMGLAREKVAHSMQLKKDPRINLLRCGATQEEAEVLAHLDDAGHWIGERVELNAMGSEQLLTWLEKKLAQHGAQKFVPSPSMLADAYRFAKHRDRIQAAVDAVPPSPTIPVPKNLTARVRARLVTHPTESWDTAVLAVLDA